MFRPVLGESNVMLSRQSTTGSMDPWKWYMNSGYSVAMFDCWREWPFADMSPYNSYTSDLATTNSVKQTKTQTRYHLEPAIHQCSQQLSRDWYSAYPAPQCITAFFVGSPQQSPRNRRGPWHFFVAPVGDLEFHGFLDSPWDHLQSFLTLLLGSISGTKWVGRTHSLVARVRLYYMCI